MTTDDRAERLLEEAMDWLLRLRAEPDAAALRRAHAAWIDADAAHARAWAQAERTWSLIGDVPPVHMERRNESVRGAHPGAARSQRRRPARWRTLALGLAGAAVTAGLTLFVEPGALLRLRADHATTTAELRTVTLADGSMVHLGPQSAIGIGSDPARRGVRLLAGEAFFEVKPNPDRPFVVETDGVLVTVLGTAFDVRLDTAATTVGVRSGTVAVHVVGTGPTTDERLTAGQRLTVALDEGRIVRAAVAPGDVASWRDGLLFLDGATVADAVAELRRYQPGWILLDDARLAERRVTGLYDLRRPDEALRALVQPHGGRVREIGPFLRVLSMP